MCTTCKKYFKLDHNCCKKLQLFHKRDWWSEWAKKRKSWPHLCRVVVWDVRFNFSHHPLALETSFNFYNVFNFEPRHSLQPGIIKMPFNLQNLGVKGKTGKRALVLKQNERFLAICAPFAKLSRLLCWVRSQWHVFRTNLFLSQKQHCNMLERSLLNHWRKFCPPQA